MPEAVTVFADDEALSRSAADLFFLLSADAVAARGKFTVALSGGATPLRMYELLAADPLRLTVPWRQVHVFWGDERCVPTGHRDSNFGAAHRALLSRVDVPPEQVHRMRCELGPASAAAAYDKELRELFGAGPPPAFDLIVLGLGEDGHTASLFPRSAALNVTAHLAVPVMLPPPVHQRVTLTLPVLNNAQHVLFLVSGSAKAPALREVFFGIDGRHFPASLVHPVNGYLRWFVSRDAASLLEQPAE
jgi:6-phosphogluconolactonase